MKKRIVTLLAVAALVALSAVAFAAPRAGRAAQDALTPEKRAAVQKIFEAHQEKLYELREQIWAKHAELQALTASGKAERGDIQSLVGDIGKLRNAMHQERQAIRKEIETQTGIKGFGPGGFHHGFGGYGYGGCGDGGCGYGSQGKGMGRGMGPGMGFGPGMGMGGY
jgi:zinc resistance-associated protein